MSFVSDTALSWISISYKEETAGVGQELMSRLEESGGQLVVVV